MRVAHLLLVITLTGAAAAPVAAQTITLSDPGAARVGLKAGYGGHGLDWDASVDSPLLGDVLRFRGSVGQGLWHSEFDSSPDPAVTRLAASALWFIRVPHIVKPYVGLGAAAYLPGTGNFSAQRGARLTLGMEGSGERWTVGVEVELDLTDGRNRPFVDALYPTGRIGLALRRAF